MIFKADKLINEERIMVSCAMETSNQSTSGLKHGSDRATRIVIWNKVNTRYELCITPYIYCDDGTLLFHAEYEDTTSYLSTCVRIFESMTKGEIASRVDAADDKGFCLEFNVENLKMLIQPILNSSEEMNDVIDEVLFYIGMIKRYSPVKDCRIAKIG